METREEYSYGIIPLFRDSDLVKVFLIHQISRRGDVIWTFPKGHGEEGETPLQTAKREVYEETGLCPDVTDETKSFSLYYEFEFEGVRIKKTTTYFVGMVKEPTWEPQEAEVKDAGWFLKNEALEKLTFPDYKDILKKVFADLDNTCKNSYK